MDKKNSPYYHLIAWSLPLVLTITVMTLSGVDGDSLFGICFVGVDNKRMRVIFFLIPLCLGLLGCCFFIKGKYCRLIYMLHVTLVLVFIGYYRFALCHLIRNIC